MKIEMITRTESKVENCDYRDAVHIKINDKKVFKVSDGEPEDSNLSRDFSGVYNIPKLLEMAYNAGRNGESFELLETESEEI